MSGNQTILDPPELGSAQAQAASGRATERKSHVFTFDKSYWSAGPRDDPQYCSQETLYNDLGVELLEHGFSGFNACILACTSILLDQFRIQVPIRGFQMDKRVW
jgi:kinesin family member 1